MVKRLKIKATDENDRIKEFCQLMGKPVAENPRQIRTLALGMEYFLSEVEKNLWDQNSIKVLVEDPNNRQKITQLINDYGIVTGKNIFEEAAKIRNKGIK